MRCWNEILTLFYVDNTFSLREVKAVPSRKNTYEDKTRSGWERSDFFFQLTSMLNETDDRSTGTSLSWLSSVAWRDLNMNADVLPGNLVFKPFMLVDTWQKWTMSTLLQEKLSVNVMLSMKNEKMVHLISHEAYWKLEYTTMRLGYGGSWWQFC